ncbi:MAG: pilin [Parcubacteria group bacterium]|nr:pilin [Parcubacteria group bacterium]MCR4343067.1 pilin [Patescibacteria group bacterium]
MKFSLPSILSLMILLFVFSLTFIPVFVSAWAPGQSIVPCGLGGGTSCKACHIFPLANNVISFILLGLAMPFAVVMILWGGILMVTGAGNPGQLEKGKNYLTWAVIGLVVAFAGWIIVDTIIKALTVKTNWGASASWSFGPWNEIPACK